MHGFGQLRHYCQTLKKPGKRRRVTTCDLIVFKSINSSDKILGWTVLPSQFVLWTAGLLLQYNTSSWQPGIELKIDCSGIVSMASADPNMQKFYIVYLSSPKQVLTKRLTPQGLVTISDPIQIPEVVSFVKSGSNNLLYIVTSTDTIYIYSVTDFAVNLMQAVQDGYTACGYISDKVSAKHAIKPSNQQITEALRNCCNFFSEWHTRKTKESGKKTLDGSLGSLCTRDTDCIQTSEYTINTNLKRLNDLVCTAWYSALCFQF